MKNTIKTLALITVTVAAVKAFERVKFNHYLTQYKENGKQIAESWIQLDFDDYYHTFSSKKIVLN